MIFKYHFFSSRDTSSVLILKIFVCNILKNNKKMSRGNKLLKIVHTKQHALRSIIIKSVKIYSNLSKTKKSQLINQSFYDQRFPTKKHATENTMFTFSSYHICLSLFVTKNYLLFFENLLP